MKTGSLYGQTMLHQTRKITNIIPVNRNYMVQLLTFIESGNRTQDQTMQCAVPLFIIFLIILFLLRRDDHQ